MHRRTPRLTSARVAGVALVEGAREAGRLALAAVADRRVQDGWGPAAVVVEFRAYRKKHEFS
jgi:hypothetical protein